MIKNVINYTKKNIDQDYCRFFNIRKQKTFYTFFSYFM